MGSGVLLVLVLGPFFSSPLLFNSISYLSFGSFFFNILFLYDLHSSNETYYGTCFAYYLNLLTLETSMR